ncbi:MAG: hypothetical protein AAF789_05140, partial [Bacteroidota bacterium]
MRFPFFLFCFSAFYLNCISQDFSSQVFHSGFVVSTKKDTIRGPLKYDMETNLVTIVANGKARTLSRH